MLPDYRIRFFSILLASVIVLGAHSSSFGQTLENAMASYQKGDANAARRAWQALSQEGNADALFNLGQMYRYGYGVDVNLDSAVLYLTQAASLGHVPAQRELANLYFFEIGTPELKQNAINLWQTAARNGDGRAQYTLGVLFFTGDMVPRNQPLGFAWTLLANEVGIPEAIQLQTAMQAQLSEQDLQKGHKLTATLMTGAAERPNYAMLIGEISQLPRPRAPTQVADAGSIAAKDQPSTTPVPEEEAVSDVPAKPQVETTAMNDSPPAQKEEPPVPEPQTKQTAQDMTAQNPVVDAETTLAQAGPSRQAQADDEYSETRQVLAELITETTAGNTPPTAASQKTAVTETNEPLDLGDPLSPLVDTEGFGDSWSLQLTSFRKPENAEAHWQDMLRDYSELFTGVEKKILRFDLGPDKGVYYRLRIGPFTSKEMADQKCAELTDSNLGCLVIWP